VELLIQSRFVSRRGLLFHYVSLICERTYATGRAAVRCRLQPAPADQIALGRTAALGAESALTVSLTSNVSATFSSQVSSIGGRKRCTSGLSRSRLILRGSLGPVASVTSDATTTIVVKPTRVRYRYEMRNTQNASSTALKPPRVKNHTQCRYTIVKNCF
jgi:hypothetical protein